MDTLDMNTLVNKLQTKDNDFKKANKILQIFFFALMLIFTILYVFNPDSETTLFQRIGGGCYVTAFALLAFHFKKKHSKYNQLNYSVSVKELMMKAEKRYRFPQKNKTDSIIAITLLNVGSCFILTQYVSDDWTMLQIILTVQAIYFASGGVGFLLGLISWKKEIRPLWSTIKMQLKAFDE